MNEPLRPPGEQRFSDEIGHIAAALAAAQAEFPNVEKKHTAKVKGKSRSGSDYEYSYKYADIADVLAAVRPHLGKNQIAIIQPTVLEGGFMYVKTRLIHSSGQWMECEYPVGNVKEIQSHQQIGASLTYARRYSLCALIGIAAEEDVDSGERQNGDSLGDVGPGNPPARRAKPAPQVIQNEGNGHSRPLPPRVGTGTDAHASWLQILAREFSKCEDLTDLAECQSKHMSPQKDRVHQDAWASAQLILQDNVNRINGIATS